MAIAPIPKDLLGDFGEISWGILFLVGGFNHLVKYES
jgi:hypothetical protein